MMKGCALIFDILIAAIAVGISLVLQTDPDGPGTIAEAREKMPRILRFQAGTGSDTQTLD